MQNIPHTYLCQALTDKLIIYKQIMFKNAKQLIKSSSELMLDCFIVCM